MKNIYAQIYSNFKLHICHVIVMIIILAIICFKRLKEEGV